MGSPAHLERRQFLGPRFNPFFEHAEAEYFLAWREAAGRAASAPTSTTRSTSSRSNDWGMFGFFEWRTTPRSAALFDAAEGWLRERGRDRMVGPLDFTMTTSAAC